MYCDGCNLIPDFIAFIFIYTGTWEQDVWFYSCIWRTLDVAYYFLGCHKYTPFGQNHTNSTSASKCIQPKTYVQMTTPGKSLVVS